MLAFVWLSKWSWYWRLRAPKPKGDNEQQFEHGPFEGQMVKVFRCLFDIVCITSQLFHRAQLPALSTYKVLFCSGGVTLDVSIHIHFCEPGRVKDCCKGFRSRYVVDDISLMINLLFQVWSIVVTLGN